LIQEALEAAIGSISNLIEDANRPDDSPLALDSDTQGVAGSPDIVATILKKIEEAAVFVADVTPIAVSTAGERKRPKHVANPNVLIELGYAKKALTADRIIQVWNTAFTGCGPDDLPFDMRGRRGPVAFHVPEGAPREQLRAAREKLSSDLATAIELILRTAPKAAPKPLPWHTHRDNDPSVWFESGTKFEVNEPFHGSGRIWLRESATRFVRMLPSAWSREQFKATHGVLLGHTSGFSWGQTKGGLLTYCGSIACPELAEGTQATIWFADTGEVWAVDRWIVNNWQGRPTVYGDDLVKGWKAFIAAQLPLLIANGGSFPVHIRLGVSGVSGSFWPVRNPAFGAPEALEDHAQYEFQITSPEFSSWSGGLIAAWARYRAVYSIPPPDPNEVHSVLGIMPATG
jgi:hypothetical protein